MRAKVRNFGSLLGFMRLGEPPSTGWRDVQIIYINKHSSDGYTDNSGGSRLEDQGWDAGDGGWIPWEWHARVDSRRAGATRGEGFDIDLERYGLS